MIPGVELLVWAGLAACGSVGPQEPAGPGPAAAAPQSTRRPVEPGSAPGPDDGGAAPARVTIDADRPVVADPVSPEELAAWSADIAALPAEARLALTGAMNLLPGPCAPCLARDEHLARCAMEAPEGCENLPELVARMVRVARAGGGPGALRAVALVGDAWTSAGPGAGIGWPDPDSPVHVELWVDPGAGLWRQAAHTAQELVAVSAEADHMGPLSLSVRLFPTWRFRGAPVRAQALDLHRAVAAADRLGQGLPLLAALAEQSTDPPSVDAARDALPALQGPAWAAALAAADADLAEDTTDAEAIGLRAAPSWRVDGYRLRGAQGLQSLLHVVENQWLDHHDTLPPALLAIDAPRPGKSR
ncbi:MAG: hypothetical protein D6798_05585 [Deltaproteobacteria bacterium]|nr:MAG: hypothetical protein D6798_05585 [Deltaproteobacteria bacterium]